MAWCWRVAEAQEAASRAAARVRSSRGLEPSPRLLPFQSGSRSDARRSDARRSVGCPRRGVVALNAELGLAAAVSRGLLRALLGRPLRAGCVHVSTAWELWLRRATRETAGENGCCHRQLAEPDPSCGADDLSDLSTGWKATETEAAKTRLRLIRLRRGAATRLRGGGDRMQRAT
eukprot:COSAG06_NODE_3777_length_4916_cov_5.355823_2_plen_174_part_01